MPHVQTQKPVKVMNTAFRDGFQSVYGARVLTEDFLPAVEAATEAGFTHFEAGGGARFQALYFYCNEDAFAMMDAFREAAGPDANLQTLARGVNVVGLESQSSDVIRLHAQLFKKHGITTIRNFDALNDVENLVFSGRCIAEAGLRHEVVVTMMELPPGCSGSHTPEYYESVLRQILDAEIPYSSVCFKDASGTATPAKVHETIRRARQLLPDGTEIRFHTHETAGISVAQYQAALEAGVDGIDLSMAPCSGGTAQPDVAVMWHALRGTGYELDVDVEKAMEAELVFRDCMKAYEVPPEALAVEPLIPWSPMPGGALTANTQMMRDQGTLERFPEVLQAMGEVVRRGGFGTSVTPVSQFYFQQAFNNAIFGPWKKIAEGYGRMVLGYYGRTPLPPDPEVVQEASEQLGLEPNRRPILELNDEDPEKGLEPASRRLELAGVPATDEHLFVAATCGEKGIAFLDGRGKVTVRKKSPSEEELPAPGGPVEAAPAPRGQSRYTVVVDGRTHDVLVSDEPAGSDPESVPRAEVHARPHHPENGREPPSAAAPTAAAIESENSGADVRAKVPGEVLKLRVREGDEVSEGQVLIVLEAMKMEIEVPAPRSGRVTSLSVREGDAVSTGHPLLRLG